jgi:hypothetical protein
MMNNQTQTNALVVAQRHNGRLLQQANQIFYLKSIMKAEVHYGKPYAGSKKDTLLKPGAEWLAKRFKMRPEYVTTDKALIVDWEHPERSYVMYEITCIMYDIPTGRRLGDASGACNSLEEKYRYRGNARLCPKCDSATIVKSKFPDRNTGDIGWWCNAKAGGCGANFHSTDTTITSQQEGKVVNTNPFDLQNTILKMAQKRAFVSAVLVATGGSSYFAPGDDAVSDLFMEFDEEEVIDGEFDEIPIPDEFPMEAQAVSPKPAQKQKQQPPPAQTKPAATPPAQQKQQQSETIDAAKFFDWSFSTFVLDETQTLAALEASVNYRVATLDAFKETKTYAMAAVLAAAHKYDPAATETFTGTMAGSDDFRFEIWQECKKIIALNTLDEQPKPAAGTKPASWKDEEYAAIREYTRASFRFDEDSLMEGLGISDWAELGSVVKAKERVRAYVAEHHIAMVATKFKFQGNHVELNTVLPTRNYGFDNFRELGEDWAAAVEEWKKLAKGSKGDLLRPLVVFWKPGKNGGYNEVMELVVITPQDDAW